jgi:hypothetical protein
LPPRIIKKSLVSDRVVIDAIVSKYADHCPLYRQSAILERDSGVELSRQTLDGWVIRVGELLVPLAEGLRQELLGGSYLQVDETPVGVQMHDGIGRHFDHIPTGLRWSRTYQTKPIDQHNIAYGVLTAFLK